MDIAGLSVLMKNQQVRMDASLAVMNQTKAFTEQTGEQLIEMLEKSAPHPALGKNIDLSV